MSAQRAVELPGDAAHPRVVMVTGAYPPDVCGVGDYTAKLVGAAPAWWHLFVERNWALAAMPRMIRRLLRLNPSHVVIQYPTQGYGWSIVPHLLVVYGALTRRYQPALALHEFSSLSGKAQLCLALCSHFAHRLLFTTEVERARARRHPLFSQRVESAVIGIISNIPAATAIPAFRARSIDVAYFGHIRPNKGVETFLEVAAAVRLASATARIALIGEIPVGYETFAEEVLQACLAMRCEPILGQEEQAVAQTLAHVKSLYLPFPDGVSARRGSALAGMANGAIVMSRVGEATPDSMHAALVPVHGTADDAATVLRVLALSDAAAGEIQAQARAYIAGALPRDWAHVAELYAEALGLAREEREAAQC